MTEVDLRGKINNTVRMCQLGHLQLVCVRMQCDSKSCKHTLTLKYTPIYQSAFPPSIQGVPERSAEKNCSNTRERQQKKKKLIVQPRLRDKGQSEITTDINHAPAQLLAGGSAPTFPGRCEIPAVRNN